MVNYNEIIENLEDWKVKALLEALGADVIDKPDALICSTICHNVDAESASHKLYYYKNSHLFYCYTECGAMNFFKFLEHYYETRNISYDWYEDVYLVILNCSVQQDNLIIDQIYKSQRDKYNETWRAKELTVYPNNILNMFTTFYPIEWLNDRISCAAMDKFNIKYCISQNKIIIPHYDINNKLVGIRGRALNPEEVDAFGKYTPLQIEGNWYSHPLSLNLYGLNQNKENIKKSGVCYIFESEKSVLQCDSFSLPNCAVACCGSNINKFQINLLLKYCKPREIIICFDHEELPHQTKYFLKLYDICRKYQNYCRFSFIYDRKNITKMKDSPSDNGEEIFQQLLNERIKVY